MTEHEAISVLKMIETHGSLPTNAKDEAIKALEEVQQYRAIGTVEKVREYKEISDNMEAVSMAALCVSLNKLKEYQKIGTPEECRAAVEKQKEKKIVRVKLRQSEWGSEYRCPVCESDLIKTVFFNEDGTEPNEKISWCSGCGQKLDWSDEK